MDTLKHFDDFKNKQQICMKSCFLIFESIYIYIYILWKIVQYIIHWDKTQLLKKKFLRIKWTFQKMHPFFFHKLQLITDLLLIRNSYVSWSTWLIALKLSMRFSIFDSVMFLLIFCIFLFNKKHGLFDFKAS